MNRTNPPEREIPIRGDLITLGQLIKVLDLVSSGAEVKMLLAEARILVNGEPENRRGRKLHPGDLVVIAGHPPVRIVSNH